MKLEWDEVELETIFFRMVGKSGHVQCGKKTAQGEHGSMKVSKPYKLPSKGRMKIEIQNKVIYKNADSDLT